MMHKREIVCCTGRGSAAGGLSVSKHNNETPTNRHTLILKHNAVFPSLIKYTVGLFAESLSGKEVNQVRSEED